MRGRHGKHAAVNVAGRLGLPLLMKFQRVLKTCFHVGAAGYGVVIHERYVAMPLPW